jgi:hypothetical protein
LRQEADGVQRRGPRPFYDAWMWRITEYELPELPETNGVALVMAYAESIAPDARITVDRDGLARRATLQDLRAGLFGTSLVLPYFSEHFEPLARRFLRACPPRWVVSLDPWPVELGPDATSLCERTGGVLVANHDGSPVWVIEKIPDERHA